MFSRVIFARHLMFSRVIRCSRAWSDVFACRLMFSRDIARVGRCFREPSTVFARHLMFSRARHLMISRATSYFRAASHVFARHLFS